MRKKTKIAKIRLTPEELETFKKKANRFGSVSKMIREAVTSLDDVAVSSMFQSMNDYALLMKQYESSLGHIGGNLNQIAHYCNVMRLKDEASQHYIESVALSEIKKLQLQLNSIIRNGQQILKLAIKAHKRVHAKED